MEESSAVQLTHMSSELLLGEIMSVLPAKALSCTGTPQASPMMAALTKPLCWKPFPLRKQQR